MTWWTVAIGVDTHEQWHVAVALDRFGRLIDWLTVDATAAGYQQLLVWARRLGQSAFGIVGCGSYGAGLARCLADHGERVFECERPKRDVRRGGKNDVVDAALAARRDQGTDGRAQSAGRGDRDRAR